jgi:hypothetical protein
MLYLIRCFFSLIIYGRLACRHASAVVTVSPPVQHQTNFWYWADVQVQRTCRCGWHQRRLYATVWRGTQSIMFDDSRILYHQLRRTHTPFDNVTDVDLFHSLVCEQNE